MKKKRILFVEDVAIFREPIQAALEQEGYKVETATNGLEALDRLQKSIAPFDLFLLDISMPEMDGFSFLARARERHGCTDIPAIVLTAVAERDFVLKARELNIKDYLVKAQFSLGDLLGRIKNLLA
jgi:CheY-like chemotaxis protein